jgi:hypothetical protein
MNNVVKYSGINYYKGILNNVSYRIPFPEPKTFTASFDTTVN